MRRLPLTALTTAAAAALVVTGVNEAAFAAKPPTFTTQEMSLQPSQDAGRCVMTLDWDVSDPAAVANYHVQANNAPLKGRTDVGGEPTSATVWTWEFEDDTAFYMKITIVLASGKESKSWSVGSDSWSCLP